jgi:hypothetical protein
MAHEKRVGADFAHAIVDDHSRLAYVELHDDEKAATVTAFVERGLSWFERRGITARRLMTDNAFSYVKTARCASCSLDAKSSTCARRLTGRARMARSSASTRRWRGSGATACPTAHTAIATVPCHTGSPTTTSRDPTARSEAYRRSAAFTTYVGRTADMDVVLSSMKGRLLSRASFMDFSRLGAGSLTALRLGRLLQSSIRSRGADQSVVRCSGAQSSGRPSCASEAMTTVELARACASRRRRGRKPCCCVSARRSCDVRQLLYRARTAAAR